MSTTNINQKVKELKELQRMSDELNAEIEAIKDELKAEMAARNTNEILTSEYKLRYTEVTSSRFDTSSFKNKRYSPLARKAPRLHILGKWNSIGSYI